MICKICGEPVERTDLYIISEKKPVCMKCAEDISRKFLNSGFSDELFNEIGELYLENMEPQFDEGYY